MTQSLLFAVSALTLAVAASVGGLVARQTSSERSDAAAGSQEAIREIALLGARLDLERAALDAMSPRLLQAVGAPAGDRSIDPIDATLGELIRLAGGDAPTADVAAEVLDLVQDVGDPDGASFDDLLTLAFEVVFDERFPAGTPETSLGDLTVVTNLPLVIAHEAIAAHSISTGIDSSDDALREHLERMAEVVVETPGWLGGPDEPLRDSFVPVPSLDAEAPELLAEADDILRSSGIVDVDQWLLTFATDAPGPAPDTIGAMVASADVATSELTAVWEREAAAARADLTAQSDSATSAGSMWRLLSFVLAGIAALLVGLVVALVASAIRSSRRLADDASTDELTGVGNRRMLHRRTADLLGDRHYTHHAVAMVDLDRFKMINDTYGHAHGDRILLHVANRLVQAATSLTADRADAAFTVVRLGGDEFVVTVHDRRELVADVVESALTADAGTTVDIDGDEVPVEFSVGLVLARGPSELDDVLAGADLRAYEAKRRRSDRWAVAPPEQASIG